jgi:hypothetical protein
LHKLADLPPIFGEKISAGVWYEFGSTFDDSDLRETKHGITIGTITETFLGPIFIGGSLGEEGRTNFYFAIGRFF